VQHLTNVCLVKTSRQMDVLSACISKCKTSGIYITACLELLEISWNLKSFLEISWNFTDAPGKFNCQVKYDKQITETNYVFKPEKLSSDNFLCSFITVRRSALHGLCDSNSVCPSVCLSHSWTVSTWFDLRS